jgi:hypothetical protein
MLAALSQLCGRKICSMADFQYLVGRIATSDLAPRCLDASRQTFVMQVSFWAPYSPDDSLFVIKNQLSESQSRILKSSDQA